MSSDTTNPKRFLRLPEVVERTQKERSAIYAMIAKGKFPAPRKIGERSVAWLSSEIDEWIETRPAGVSPAPCGRHR